MARANYNTGIVRASRVRRPLSRGTVAQHSSHAAFGEPPAAAMGPTRAGQLPAPSRSDMSHVDPTTPLVSSAKGVEREAPRFSSQVPDIN